MHSSSADWVLGVARLISSASTTWAMIGPGPELELLGLLVVDRQAGHVRRQQVRRELDAPEGAAEAASHRLGEHRLAGPGNVFDEQMAAAQQGDESQADLLALADDHALDVRSNLLAGLLNAGHDSLFWTRGG